MAFIPTPPQGDEEQQPTIGGGGGGLLGQPPQGGGVQTATETGFTDLRRYLEENKPQSEKFAETIKTDLGQGAESARTGITEAGEQFGEQATEQNRYDTSFIDQVAAAPENYASGSDLEKFQQLATGTFLGPESLRESELYSPVLGLTEEAQRRADLTRDASGLGLLSGEYSADPTVGKSSLNAALLGQTPGAQESFTQARTVAGELTPYLAEQNRTSEGTVADLMAGLETARSEITPRFEGIQETFGGRLASNYERAIAQARAERNAQIAERNRELQAINAARRTANLAGVEPGGVDLYHNIDQYTGSPFTREQFATADQYARELALETLLGNTTSFLPSDPSQAGMSPELLRAFLASEIADPATYHMAAPPSHPELTGDYMGPEDPVRIDDPYAPIFDPTGGFF
jgi:chorismate mutase